MLELAAAIVVSAIAISFASDILSRALKVVAPRRRNTILVASEELSG